MFEQCELEDKIIGVLGGMGPGATADFLTKLVSASPADSDQEHPRVLVWSDSSIPDRTQALAGKGPDPVPLLIKGAELLEKSGAAFIVVPCNTAHAFLPRVLQSVAIPGLDMIKIVGGTLEKAYPEVCRVGLLATSGTIGAALYQRELAGQGIEVIAPTADVQEKLVMPGIRDVKRGRRDDAVREAIYMASESLVSDGAEVIIGGCTEVPLVLGPEDVRVPFLDSTQLLAQEAVERARS